MLTKRVQQNFNRAIESYDNNAIAQKEIVKQLLEIGESYSDIKYNSILEIGCGTGNLSCHLSNFNPTLLALNDLCPENRELLEQKIVNKEIATKYYWGDAETISFNEKYNLIASSSAIQWFKDLPLFFDKCHTLLEDGGHLLISTFGSRNMHQFSSILNCSLNYNDIDILEEYLSPKFKIKILKRAQIELKFDSPIDILHHIKRTGVNSVIESPWTKERHSAFCDLYPKLFSDYNNKLILTYEPIYILAQKQ